MEHEFGELERTDCGCAYGCDILIFAYPQMSEYRYPIESSLFASHFLATAEEGRQNQHRFPHRAAAQRRPKKRKRLPRETSREKEKEKDASATRAAVRAVAEYAAVAAVRARLPVGGLGVYMQ